MVTPSPSALTPAITPPNPRIQLTDQSGVLSSTGLSILQKIRSVINGATPTISCTCTNVGNLYTITPFKISPQVLNYYSYASFAFVASATSTGAVTATVVPTTGPLPTLPVFTPSGANAASGDLVAGLFYILYFVDTYPNGVGTGGFALR